MAPADREVATARSRSGSAPSGSPAPRRARPARSGASGSHSRHPFASTPEWVLWPLSRRRSTNPGPDAPAPRRDGDRRGRVVSAAAVMFMPTRDVDGQRWFARPQAARAPANCPSATTRSDSISRPDRIVASASRWACSPGPTQASPDRFVTSVSASVYRLPASTATGCAS